MSQILEIQGGNYILLVAIFLPVLILIIIIIINNFKSLFLKNSPPLPPGPTPWPILGNIPHMTGSMPHIALTNFSKIHGPIISLRLGTQCLIVGSSPEFTKEIFKTKDRIFSGRYVPQSIPNPRSELNQSSIVWAEECADGWKYLRSICRSELFSGKASESQASMTEKNVTNLMRFLRNGGEGEVVVSIGEVAFVTAFNVVANALMSTDLVSLEKKHDAAGLKSVVKEGIDATGAPNLADCYPIILGKLDFQGLRKKTREFYQKMNAAWEHVIEDRRIMRKRRGDDDDYSLCHQDLLDTLLDKGFANHRINQVFTELFAAGTDTTTSTIEWTMAELLKNPECIKRTRAEIESEIKKDFPKSFNSMQLPYLQACIKEVLRLHPPTPFSLPHRALETCQVMNYTIPKNAQVLVNLWAISRDPSIWEEPLKFNPDRFLSSNMDFKGNDFEFLPFGGGRRICPGLPMAAKTIPLILVSLIHFFDWSLPDGKDLTELNMNEKFGATMNMEHPLMLISRARRT